jgi:hypothetical protein
VLGESSLRTLAETFGDPNFMQAFVYQPLEKVEKAGTRRALGKYNA